MNNGKQRGGTRKLTGLSIFTAIVVVLQVLCTFVKFGPFSITLALAPIIIGAAVYGKNTGAYLGFVFGLVVLITGILGWDGGVVMLLMGENPIGCVLICLVKGAAAGWISGLVYEFFARKSEHMGVVVAGVVCPVINTGLFIVGMLVFFLSTLESWAGAQAMIFYVIFGLTGINFLVELGVNILLSSGITRIIKAGKTTH